MDIHQYDDNVADLEMGNLVKVLGQVIGQISTPLGSPTPDVLESVEAQNNLDVEAKIAWEVLKTQLTLHQQVWVPYDMLSLPWHFFVVNDGKKPNPLIPQTMHCLVCHFVYQTCCVGSTTKKWRV